MTAAPSSTAEVEDLWELLVAAIDPEKLSQAGRVEALTGLEHVIRWAQAKQHQVVASMSTHAAQSADPVDKTGKQWVREDIACALSITTMHATSLLSNATSLVEQFPDTLAALEVGELSLRQAQDLIEQTAPLDPRLASKVEDAVLPKAPGRTAPQFRQIVRRAVARFDQREQHEKHAALVDERRVVVTPQPNGVGELWATGPMEDIITIATALQARSDKDKKLPGECRTPDQRRFDALVGLAQHALNGCGNGSDVQIATWQGRKPNIQVTVALSTLLGLDEQPAELAGYGPITAAKAITIASDPSATWRNLITDNNGHLLDLGRTSYRPNQELRDFVLAQSPTCRFPVSNMNSRRAEIDHVISWFDDDGETNVDNLEPLGSRPHHLKHEAGWAVEREPDGTMIWTSPTGHVYKDPPYEHPVDHTGDSLRAPPDNDAPPF